MRKIFSLLFAALMSATMAATAANIYFVNADDWTAVNVYMWGTEDAKNAAWPGAAMTKTSDKAHGKDVYSYEVPASPAGLVNVIFNDGSSQTSNLTYDAAKPYYYNLKWYATLADVEAASDQIEKVTLYFVNKDNWEKVQAYAFDGSTYYAKWPGEAMTKTGEKVLEKDIYSYSFPVNYTKVIFNNKVGDTGTQTEDLTWSAAKPYYYDGEWYASKEAIQPATPADPGTGDYYLKNNWGAGADWAWKAMTKDGDNYKLEKVVFGGGGVNVNTKAEDCEECWIKAEDFLGDKIAARDTVTLVLNSAGTTITATLLGKYVAKGDVVYYLKNNWDAGADWTWKAMTKDGDNYKLENVTFGGLGVNYSTIASGDGEGWIPVDDFKGDKIYAKDVVNLTFSPSAKTITAKLITSGGGKPADPANFYLAGSFNDWKVNDLYKFAPNSGTAGEYVLMTTLNTGDQLKVLGVEDDQSETWYPDGMGNEYTVDEANAGNVTVYFRPAKNADWTLLNGYISIVKTQAIDNTADGAKAVKTIENGTLVIIKNGVKYTISGSEIR